MPERTFLSIIIPAYNEEKNISATLLEIAEYLKGRDFSCEVIVVDDGSDDATVQKTKELEGKFRDLRVIESTPNRGKGHVLKKGMLMAGGTFRVFMDADNSTSIRELDKFIPFLEEGFDVYIASRKIQGAKVSMPFKREFLGKIFILMARILLGVRVSDINCGFKLFRNEAAEKLFSSQVMDDWSFDAEILFLARKYGCKIKEIPVEWVYKATSKVRPLRDGIKSFIGLVRIRLNGLSGKY